MKIKATIGAKMQADDVALPVTVYMTVKEGTDAPVFTGTFSAIVSREEADTLHLGADVEFELLPPTGAPILVTAPVQPQVFSDPANGDVSAPAPTESATAS